MIIYLISSWALVVIVFFCGLMLETAEHLFLQCNKAKLVWNQVASLVGKNLCFPYGYGVWLTDYNHSMFIISIIVATSWFLWKPTVTPFLSISHQIMTSYLVELLLTQRIFLRLIIHLLANVSLLTNFPALMVFSYSLLGSGIILER